MVIFDGEKRFEAYKTFNRVRDRVALAIFDDVNVGQLHAITNVPTRQPANPPTRQTRRPADPPPGCQPPPVNGKRFCSMLDGSKQVWWDTRDKLFESYRDREKVPLSLISHLRNR